MMPFHYGFGGMWGWGSLGGLLVPLLVVTLFAALTGLGIWVSRRSGYAFSRTPARQPSAQEILKLRYARGELSRERFHSLMEDLG